MTLFLKPAEQILVEQNKVLELKEAAVAASGLISVRHCLEDYFQENAEEVKLRLSLIMIHLLDDRVLWRPFRADMPQPFFRVHMQGDETGTGTVNLEGGWGTWGLSAAFREDTLFAFVMNHGRSRIDVAYIIPPTGIEALMPDPNEAPPENPLEPNPSQPNINVQHG